MRNSHQIKVKNFHQRSKFFKYARGLLPNLGELSCLMSLLPTTFRSDGLQAALLRLGASALPGDPAGAQEAPPPRAPRDRRRLRQIRGAPTPPLPPPTPRPLVCACFLPSVSRTLFLPSACSYGPPSSISVWYPSPPLACYCLFPLPSHGLSPLPVVPSSQAREERVRVHL